MFTQPIVMKCNSEQFELVKSKLIPIGYKISSTLGKWDSLQQYIVTNCNRQHDVITSVNNICATNNDRIVSRSIIEIAKIKLNDEN